MSKYRCLITGASGFIGGHFAERLKNEGYIIRCLVRRSSNIELIQKLNAEICYSNLTDTESISKAVEDCDYVFHCAAHVGDWGTKNEIRNANVVGTKNIIKACLEGNIKRLIYISTTDVYGYPNFKADETCPYYNGFRNWYSATKIEAEKLVFRAIKEDKLPAVILRPASVYGIRSHSFVTEIVEAIKDRMLFHIDKGTKIAGLCYIDHLLDMALLSLKSDKALGEAFNVSDGSEITWKGYFDKLADLVDAPKVKLSLPYPLVYGLAYIMEQGYRLLRTLTGFHSRPLLSRLAVNVLGKPQSFSIEKAKRLLGYTPQISFDKAMETIGEWINSKP